MPLSKELVQSVRKRVADDPGVSTELLALEFKASEAEVITALPLEMRLRGRNSAFEVIWNTVSKWEKVEVKLPLDPKPSFRDAQGGARTSSFPFRLSDTLPERPIKADEVAFIWFITKPRQNEKSLSVRFFDKLGDHMLSVYLKPDQNGEFDSGYQADFDAMRERFGVIPVPKNRCKGCQSCTCQTAN